MHWLDITILIALGIAAALGFWTGLLWQIARVVGLVLSLYIAIVSNNAAASWIGARWKDTSEPLCHVIAFVVVFIGVFLLLYLMTRSIHSAIKAAKLETVDRVLGAILGMLKMSVIISGICAAMLALDLEMTRAWKEKSTLPVFFAKGTNLMLALIPQGDRERLDENVQKARDQLQQKVIDAAIENLKK